jgi:pyridoxal phosphate-dependent aminotransferase EpsN
MPRIYLSVPHMGTNEERYVQEAFASNWLSTVGPNLTAFEESFTRMLGRPCVALGSGTAAIHLGLRLLGVGVDDEVVVPTLTFVASVNPVVYLGARPVFVDCERTSWNLDPQRLSDLLSKRAERGKLPKVIVVVHLYGQTSDMDAIMELSQRYDVPVLEDAAEALGATYRDRPAGSIAPISAFSFNGNKIITTTGGGMLAAHDPRLVEKARHWSTQAREPRLEYHHEEMGYNYRMSNVLAGIGRGQLEVLADRVAARRRVAFRYRDAFADLPGISLMPQAPWGLHTNWLSVFSIDGAKFGASRDSVIAALAAENIEARPVWKPMHLQPLYHTAECFGGSVAEDAYVNGICLPSSSSLDAASQDTVISAVRRCAGVSR